MLLEVTVPPTVEVVSLQEIKDQLRLDTSDDDALLRSYILTAREYCAAVLNRTVSVTTYKLSLESFDQSQPDDRLFHQRYLDHGYYNRARLFDRRDSTMRLQGPPLISVTSIQYVDKNGVTQTLDPTRYVVDKDEPGFVRLAGGQSWPELGDGHRRVFITYTAGYSPVTCPATIKQAIKLLVGHYYENREATSETTKAELPFAVQALLSTQKWSI